MRYQSESELDNPAVEAWAAKVVASLEGTIDLIDEGVKVLAPAPQNGPPV